MPSAHVVLIREHLELATDSAAHGPGLPPDGLRLFPVLLGNGLGRIGIVSSHTSYNGGRGDCFLPRDAFPPTASTPTGEQAAGRALIGVVGRAELTLLPGHLTHR